MKGREKERDLTMINGRGTKLHIDSSKVQYMFMVYSMLVCVCDFMG
jgi:hypothetical protein